ncbi:histidine phosphatase family protein [Streptomyces sp. NPDC050095]|uniref:histidine phosphatase family protein n=1 Tax=unclassified Streptomyces TaxID=2593676 RepID=UPI0034164002
MTTRLLLLTPARTASLRRAVFDDGDPLDEGGAARARAAAGRLVRPEAVVGSGSVRCAQTARLLGLGDLRAVPELAGLDAGRWRGRAVDEVGAAEPEALGRWLADPEAAAPGGESVADVCARVGRWLRALADEDAGRVTAVVEPDVVRAAAVHATGAPLSAFWRLDVEPLTVTELSGRAGRWNLRVGRPLAAVTAEER